MVKEEKRKNILEELDSRITQAEIDDFEHYTQYTQRYENMPDNQFSHAWSLINVRQGKVREFDDLLHPHLFLGAIDDAKSLRFYQQDMFWLTNMFRLAKDDPAMQYVFDPLWHSFLSEVRLTSTLDGSERIYQAFKIPKAAQKGFKIFKPKKRKKEPMEYIIPDEDDQGMY
jgi:hypothetical protein